MLSVSTVEDFLQGLVGGRVVTTEVVRGAVIFLVDRCPVCVTADGILRFDQQPAVALTSEESLFLVQWMFTSGWPELVEHSSGSASEQPA